MKIINGHDYYDGAQAHGHDHSLVFLRNTSVEHEFKQGFNSVPCIEQVLILFCGRSYCAYRVHRREKTLYSIFASSWVYGEKGLEFAIECAGTVNGGQKLNDVLGRDTKKNSLSHHESDELRDWCIKHRIVTAVIRRRRAWEFGNSGVSIMPNAANLKDYEFYKIFPAFEAYQQIEMFLGNELAVNEAKPLWVEEKVRIAKHGFDPKTSFRKRKQSS